ncbi:hypothetical protein AUJ69_01460 [Candidatus Woesearchaeota archaeon CG1_02_47_18]|nr:MAG: hypothetical protein AUJ69_01460 [Candidatus Woesearchaeota archaeon CG1_02_47_18]HII30315.1 ATP-binding protein [Candidatus Woesearchaeota archaeon]
MDLTLQNPWWKSRLEIVRDEKVNEALQKEVKVLYKLEDRSNRIILGPRQVGKTSMLKLLIYDLIINKDIDPLNICYFSCEPLRYKNDIVEVIKEFEKLSSKDSFKYIFLDEVTQIPEWELAIKLILETRLSKNKMLVATGSNALLLKKGSERLPGRNISTDLFLPLSFKEFLRKFGSEGLRQALERLGGIELCHMQKVNKAALSLSIFSDELESKFNLYLKTGGYLKAIYEVLEKGRVSEETYEIYINWILGDLAKLGKSEYIFKSVLMGIIKNYGTKFSLHSIAKDTEIGSHASVADYLDVLQSLLLINQLFQLEYNKKIPLFRKERKSYFIDPLLYSVCKGYIAGKYQDYSEDSRESLIEGIICEALARRARINLDISSSLWFYLKKKETDFVLKETDKLIGIESKWQNKVSKSDFNNFSLFKNRILLSKREFKFDKTNGFLILPAYLFLGMM